MSENLLDLRWEGMPWWKWLVMREQDFAPMGLRSKYRFLITGHQQPLGHRWVMSVGRWGGCVPTISLQTAVRLTNETTFQAFRTRWKTYCSRTPKEAVRIAPWKVSLRAAHALEFAMARGHADMGYAAYTAWEMAKAKNKQGRGAPQRPPSGEPKLGILPIEYILHHHVVHEVLCFHDIPLESFMDLPDRELEEMWLEANPSQIGVPYDVQEAYFQCNESRGYHGHHEHRQPPG